jgi:putative chitinase
MLSTDQLIHIAPNLKPAQVYKYTTYLNQFMPKYNIDTKTRICLFLANLAQESDSFNYCNNIGNLPQYEISGFHTDRITIDALKFKRRGLMPITGRDMYGLCSAAIYGNDETLLNNPALLERPEVATESACWYWAIPLGLNSIADRPEGWSRNWHDKTYNRFEWIVLKITGGQHAMAERRRFLERAYEVI